MFDNFSNKALFLLFDASVTGGNHLVVFLGVFTGDVVLYQSHGGQGHDVANLCIIINHVTDVKIK